MCLFVHNACVFSTQRHCLDAQQSKTERIFEFELVFMKLWVTQKMDFLDFVSCTFIEIGSNNVHCSRLSYAELERKSTAP